MSDELNFKTPKGVFFIKNIKVNTFFKYFRLISVRIKMFKQNEHQTNLNNCAPIKRQQMFLKYVYFSVFTTNV